MGVGLIEFLCRKSDLNTTVKPLAKTTEHVIFVCWGGGASCSDMNSPLILAAKMEGRVVDDFVGAKDCTSARPRDRAGNACHSLAGRR